jgi:hypothetical protein
MTFATVRAVFLVCLIGEVIFDLGSLMQHLKKPTRRATLVASDELTSIRQ